MNCRKSTLTQIGYQGNRLFFRKVALYCKSWRCPDCSKQKARQIVQRLKNGFTGDKVRMMTLTCPKGLSIEQMSVGLSQWWHRLVNHLKRKFGLTKFAWVFELGDKKGRPHMHILIDAYVPQKQLSILAQKCGFGGIVDIRLLPTARALGYCTNYLSKGHASVALAMLQRKLHFRRFGCSRNIPKNDGKGVEWLTINYKDEISKESDYLQQLMLQVRCRGIKVAKITQSKSACTFELANRICPGQWENARKTYEYDHNAGEAILKAVAVPIRSGLTAARLCATAQTVHGHRFAAADRVLQPTFANLKRTGALLHPARIAALQNISSVSIDF